MLAWFSDQLACYSLCSRIFPLEKDPGLAVFPKRFWRRVESTEEAHEPCTAAEIAEYTNIKALAAKPVAKKPITRKRGDTATKADKVREDKPEYVQKTAKKTAEITTGKQAMQRYVRCVAVEY